MSRKDYRLIADALRETRPEDGLQRHTWTLVAVAIAEKLGQDNSRFKLSTFYDAAGVAAVHKTVEA